MKKMVLVDVRKLTGRQLQVALAGIYNDVADILCLVIYGKLSDVNDLVVSGLENQVRVVRLAEWDVDGVAKVLHNWAGCRVVWVSDTTEDYKTVDDLGFRGELVGGMRVSNREQLGLALSCVLYCRGWFKRFVIVAGPQVRAECADLLTAVEKYFYVVYADGGFGNGPDALTLLNNLRVKDDDIVLLLPDDFVFRNEDISNMFDILTLAKANSVVSFPREKGFDEAIPESWCDLPIFTFDMTMVRGSTIKLIRQYSAPLQDIKYVGDDVYVTLVLKHKGDLVPHYYMHPHRPVHLKKLDGRNLWRPALEGKDLETRVLYAPTFEEGVALLEEGNKVVADYAKGRVKK